MIDYKNYLEARNNIVEENKNLIGVVLNKKEEKADTVLQKLKEEFKKSCDGKIRYTMPVVRDERIWNSRLYDFCKVLPKGSDLHVHGTVLLPIKELIDFLCIRKDIYINVKNYELRVKESNYFNSDCVVFKKALKEGLIDLATVYEKWTILGRKHGQNMWEYFENLFAYNSDLDINMDILNAYYIYAFEYYYKINIKHIELHLLLFENKEECIKTINTVKDAYFKVKKKHPDFILSIIGASMKLFSESVDSTKKLFDNVAWLNKNIKDDFDKENIHDFIIGIDLINEEDNSRPLKDFAELLLKYKKKYPNIGYYLHCGESINPDSDHLIDAYLLGATRIGHGINLYKYPKLLQDYANKEICIEACIISNQTLKYVKDLRLHPCAEYLKRGCTVSLASDDPMFQEHTPLVDDFFAAIVCWNLSIAEVKQLCINSILYSGVDREYKSKLLTTWKKDWISFIDKVNKMKK